MSKLREERKTAERLRESLLAMRNISDPSAFASYYPVLRDVNQLIEYLERMARILSDAADQATQISRETAQVIEEDTERTRYTSSNAIML